MLFVENRVMTSLNVDAKRVTSIITQEALFDKMLIIAKEYK